MYSMQSIDYVGVRIQRTLSDSKAFLKHDVDSLVDCVADYHSSLAAAMKKGERVQAMLTEIGSKNSDDWRKHFTALGQLQEVLNGSYAAWVASIKDLFTSPVKGMMHRNVAVLKSKSGMVKSALAQFDAEQEKSRNVVQALLSKQTLLSGVQPFYDDIRAKEGLISTKKHDILKELEYYQSEKAYEIAHLWSQVCSKQPHLANAALLKRFSLEHHPSPPLSNWTSYAKYKKPISSDLMDGAEFKHGNENPRNSMAASFYKGVKHLFQWHQKIEEDDMFQYDLNGLDDSATIGTDLRTDPSAQVSPFSTPTLTSDPPSSSETPDFPHKNPAKRTTSGDLATDFPSPHLSPIAGPATDLTPPLAPNLARNSTDVPTIAPYQTTSDSSPSFTGSPAYSSTPLTDSQTIQSFCSYNSQSSPSIILEHLSPCSIASSLCDQSQDVEDPTRAQEVADAHAALAQQALNAVNALRLQSAALQKDQNARRAASLRVHYAPNVVSASYSAPRSSETQHSDEDSSTQDTNAEDSYTQDSNAEDSFSDLGELCSEENEVEDTEWMDYLEVLGAQRGDTETSYTLEAPADNPRAQEHDQRSTQGLVLEAHDGDSENTGDEYNGDANQTADETTDETADSIATLRGDSPATDDSNDLSMSDSVSTETGEDSDDYDDDDDDDDDVSESESEIEPLMIRKAVSMPRIEGYFLKSQSGRVVYVKKSDTGRPWTI